MHDGPWDSNYPRAKVNFWGSFRTSLTCSSSWKPTGGDDAGSDCCFRCGFWRSSYLQTRCWSIYSNKHTTSPGLWSSLPCPTFSAYSRTCGNSWPGYWDERCWLSSSCWCLFGRSCFPRIGSAINFERAWPLFVCRQISPSKALVVWLSQTTLPGCPFSFCLRSKQVRGAS